MVWFVYLLECRNGSVYTGITTDVTRRYAQHASGKGARYTRSHPPVRLIGQFSCPDRSSASRAEHAIKQLSALRKRALGDSLCANQGPRSPLPHSPVVNVPSKGVGTGHCGSIAGTPKQRRPIQ